MSISTGCVAGTALATTRALDWVFCAFCRCQTRLLSMLLWWHPGYRWHDILGIFCVLVGRVVSCWETLSNWPGNLFAVENYCPAVARILGLRLHDGFCVQRVCVFPSPEM